ncbi:hypothetical protein J4Q44_G00231430 [Coregonus suidteri]|uniref:Uncharacterized protein n=1 Tax=Coregonus suidteri TaxID=861788 RepID=A0AAN8LAR2_9TELE
MTGHVLPLSRTVGCGELHVPPCPSQWVRTDSAGLLRLEGIGFICWFLSEESPGSREQRGEQKRPS